VFASPFTAGGKKEFHQLVMELMDKEAPDTFNQALLDFGALQCVPRSPNCNECPFVGICYAYRNNLIDQLPVKGKKLIPKDRFFNYIMVKHAGNTYINRREASDIWNSLYEFPLIETEQEVDFQYLVEQMQQQDFVENKILSIAQISTESQIHKLTHQHLYIRFWKVQVAGSLLNAIDYSTLLTYPFPIVIFNFIEKDWK